MQRAGTDSRGAVPSPPALSMMSETLRRLRGDVAVMSEPLTGEDSERRGGEQVARVALARRPGELVIDGVWWPRTDSLEDELPALDRAVTQVVGADIARFSYTLGTWTDRPRKVQADQHMIKLGWFTHGELLDSVDLSLNDYRRVVLTVIPPTTPSADAEELIRAVALLGPSPDVPVAVGPGAAAEGSLGSEHVAVVLSRIRGIPDPVDRLRAARDLEAELLGVLGEVRTVLARAAALVHADHPETLDERHQPPWG